MFDDINEAIIHAIKKHAMCGKRYHFALIQRLNKIEVSTHPEDDRRQVMWLTRSMKHANN